ncbi:MAG TPA: hypothetical protein VKW76_10260 [Candidatus Binatia bacterium]|nr:hypothetical protein [Candidatus Binatia bacterium]
MTAAGALFGAAFLLMPVAAAALDVQVISVHASESGPTDAALDTLRPRLRRLAGYRAFRVVRTERRQCAWHSPEEFTLPGGRSLQLLPRGMEQQAVLIQVRLLAGRHRLVDTNVRLRNRGTMLFGVGQAGRGGEGDGALIVVLRAEE